MRAHPEIAAARPPSARRQGRAQSVRRGKLRRGERGVSVVEFALVLPVFLAFMFGVTEFGRAVYYYNTVANASREGARYGIVLNRTALLAPGNVAGSYTGTSCDPSSNPNTIVCHTVA